MTIYHIGQTEMKLEMKSEKEVRSDTSYLLHIIYYERFNFDSSTAVFTSSNFLGEEKQKNGREERQ